MFLFCFSIGALIIIYSESNKLKKLEKNNENNLLKTTYDIIQPKFTINNEDDKIYITAQNGNFISKDEILLKNQVQFSSKNFKIITDEVFFNKVNQSANSKEDSIFLSEGAKIESKGFDIINEGNVILFNGKTSLILSK